MKQTISFETEVNTVIQSQVSAICIASVVLPSDGDEHCMAQYLQTLIKKDIKENGFDVWAPTVYSSYLKKSGDEACNAADANVRYKVLVAKELVSEDFHINLVRITYQYK